jgi:hypothetical protein
LIFSGAFYLLFQFVRSGSAGVGVFKGAYEDILHYIPGECHQVARVVNQLGLGGREVGYLVPIVLKVVSLGLVVAILASTWVFDRHRTSTLRTKQLFEIDHGRRWSLSSSLVGSVGWLPQTEHPPAAEQNSQRFSTWMRTRAKRTR